MRSKGYSGYRGRKKKQKKLLAVVLVLVVLLAAAFLLVQDYLVYDSNGKMRLDLPFFEKETQEQEVPLNNDEVTIDILTPEEVEDPRLPVKELHGRMMAARVLERDVEKTVAATLEDDIVIEVKRVNGFITYHSAAAIPEEVDVARGETMENFKAVLEGEKYVVARMSTLCDSYFVRAYREAALGRENGGYWYDGDNRTWLDPAHPQTLVYITSLCQELTEMGVDELMLDYFSYPTSGNLAAIYGLADVDRAAVLADFVAALRANLPEGTVLGIVLRNDLSVEDGVDAALITNGFDRVYLAPGVDTAAVKEALGSGYGAERYVILAEKAPEAGGYLIGY